MYTLGNIPADAPAWIVAEFRKIQEALNGPVDGLTLRTLYAEPKKLKDGLIAKADGTTWKPNGVGGAGVWCYYGAAWHYLG